MLKNTKINIYPLIVIFLFFLYGCGNNAEFRSSSTGWKVNDRKGGFYYNTNFEKQETAPGMVFIEGGTYIKGRIQDDQMKEWTNNPSRQHVQSFYMDETEVTNIMYLEYLYWIKKVFPPDDSNYLHIYPGVLPDTLVWRNRLGFNESMESNYLRFPSFADYPVVGVNWLQANEFAKWRTNRLNESILARAGFTKQKAQAEVDAESTFDTETYFASPTSTYGGNKDLLQGGSLSKSMIAKGRKKNLYAQRTDGLLAIEYRLPTEAEWEFAATADVGNRIANNQLGQKRYPWRGPYTRSIKKRDQLANFKQSKGDYGGIAGYSDDGSDITNKVKSYPANEYGLYDMAGNVAEWVADVYRPIIDDEVSDFNYFRGNVYMKNKFNPDGKFSLITTNTIEYDTLLTGTLSARNFPGQIVREPITSDDTYLRTNYDKSYNINYRDGDKESSRFYKNNPKVKLGKNATFKEKMYNSPMNSISVDSVGKITRQIDKSNSRSTFINDKVRLFKGGSWQDRANWLDPAQRRFINQEKSTDFIGFRCAMNRIGNKTDHPKVKRGYIITKYKKKYKSQI